MNSSKSIFGVPEIRVELLVHTSASFTALAAAAITLSSTGFVVVACFGDIQRLSASAAISR